MKTKSSWLGLGLGALSLLLFGNFASASPEDQPVITSVRLEGTNVVVTVQVPAGVKRVTLECRGRLGAGSWVPRALTRRDGAGGEVTFRLPQSGSVEVLRVRTDDREPLPASYYSGTNSFAGQPVNSGGLGPVFEGPGDARGTDPTAGSPSQIGRAHV